MPWLNLHVILQLFVALPFNQVRHKVKEGEKKNAYTQ